jgi:ribosome-associated protein
MAQVERTARRTALLAAARALDKKAEEVLVIEIGTASNVADYLMICSALSDVQVRAVAEGLRRGLRDEGIRAHHSEGLEHANWVLTDFIDVVVHIMQPAVRTYYNLEGLWADCPQRLFGSSDDPMQALFEEWASSSPPAASIEES